MGRQLTTLDGHDELRPVGALEHDLFRQLLHASWNLRRIRQVEETHKVSKPEAERLIKAKDRTRSNFLSFFAERCAHDDPLFYDLTLNMENFSIEKADKIIHLALEP